MTVPTPPPLPVRLQNGVTVYVPSTLRVTTTYVLLEQETWFEDEVKFVHRLLRPGEGAIDVGANFGVYATVMAEAIGPSGRVWAFEPSLETSELLRRTAQLKHGECLQVIRAAVSDRAGEAEFHIGDTPELSALTQPPGITTTEKVKLVTLDELISANGPPIAFIKIDAEGHELQVGRGARDILMRDEPLVMFEIKNGPTFDYHFFDFLQELGWSGYRLIPGLNLLVPFDRNEAIDNFQLNLFGCSPRRAGELQKRGLLVLNAKPVAVPAELPSVLFRFGETPGTQTAYGLALAQFGAAQQRELSADERFSHLCEALRQAERALQERNSVPRRITLARVAAELGLRSLAVRTLQETLPVLAGDRQGIWDEPFLPPSALHVPREDGPAGEIARIAALETFELLRSFSSVFIGKAALPLVEHLCQSPFSGPEMHRRRQLLKMASGVQARPVREPKLIRESTDNLNAWFWGG